MKTRLLLVASFFTLNSFSQNPTFTLEGNVTEANSKKPILGATVKLVGSDNTSIETKTDSVGHYSFLSPAVKPNTSYVVSASALDVRMQDFPSGFLGNPKAKIITVGDSISKTFRQDFVLIKTIICFGPFPMITFDKNSDSIMPSQFDSLDFLFKILTENPNITIELSSHCSYDETNPQALSYKRAKKVVEWLIVYKGINPERVSPAAYGNIKPFVVNEEYTLPSGKIIPRGTVLSKEWIKKNLLKPEDQEYAARLNRRITFMILRKDYAPQPK